MNELLRRRFSRANTLYLDFVDAVSAEQLGSHLADLPSDTVGHQLWCVLGARESYPRAAKAGEWQGFTSPVTADETTDAAALRAALVQTSSDVGDWITGLDAEDEASLTYALALLEHETQHHGQLIRYLYGLGIDRPESWQRQYALDEDF
ncbi:DinB family protein [Microbacterium sp. NPDC056057]|uniref:DinB family protein n=1 Tax=Microbacterium sp. NPDC056057 TaxID=3345699 RepID=UPI0035E212C4